MDNTVDILAQANNYFNQSEFKKALSLYYQILSLDLERAGSYYNIGLTYEMLNEYELAVSYYKKAIRIDNNHIRSINNLARIYMEVIKDNNIAREYLDYAIKINPNDAEAYNLYSGIYIEENDFKLAENYLKKSIFLDSNFFKNYFDLANLYYKTSDKENAVEMINKCLELNNNFTPALELSAKIKSM